MTTSISATELLLQRQSSPQLTAPAPNDEQLDIILKAGMRAPDHGALTPWHFTILKEQGLEKLSAIFYDIAKKHTDDDFKIEKAKNMPFRAPMIIVISTRYQAHEKVPKQEQLVAAGCAAHAMQMAAYAQGLGGMWRTGDFSYIDEVKLGLGIQANEDIVGYLYLGHPKKELPVKPAKSYQDYVTYL